MAIFAMYRAEIWRILCIAWHKKLGTKKGATMTPFLSNPLEIIVKISDSLSYR